jgi:hypothetical protein
MVYHVVRAGEDVQTIAYRYRVEPEQIWQHPDNDGLREKGRSATVLHPGDLVYVPDPPAVRKVLIAPGSHTEFQGFVPRTSIKIRFQERDGTPRSHQRFIAESSVLRQEGITDDEGIAEFEVRMDARTVRVTLPDAAIQYAVSIGDLDPIEEVSGIQSRLRALGYFGGPVDGIETPALRAAIERFQRTYGIPVRGEIDTETREELSKSFGG